MESISNTRDRDYQPSPRMRAFRIAFGLLVLTALVAIGVQP